MSSERESNEIKKAMAYDLLKILEKAEDSGQESYTIREIKNLIDNYITTATSNS